MGREEKDGTASIYHCTRPAAIQRAKGCGDVEYNPVQPGDEGGGEPIYHSEDSTRAQVGNLRAYIM